MSYNVTVLDKGGNYKTVYLTPDKDPHVDNERVATNHQQAIDWLAYEEFTAIRERKVFLDVLVNEKDISRDQVRSRFLQPPLYNKDIQKNFVTLYTVQYDLEELSATVFWTGRSTKQSFDNFREERMYVNLNKANKGEFSRG